MMCAGDGLCVTGVWQIYNEMPSPISFRTYSQNCPTGVPLDTWGTSIAETVPDILNASGLCSYRSWFENRRMATRNNCNMSDTCPNFNGFQPWNFSAPHAQAAGQGAFDSGVLQVQAHPCDRDYQYYANMVSCTPGDNFVAMFDGSGIPTSSVPPKDNRTLTYRVGRSLPLMHHVDETAGPTYGFTGVPKTYADLGLGSSATSIVPCTSVKVCGFQPSFLVNNLAVGQRLVLDDTGTVRAYAMQDLLTCGVFGFVMQGGTTCQLDFAVVPLAQFVLNTQNGLLSQPGFASIRLKLKVIYVPDQTIATLAALSALPDLILTLYIGGSPATLQDYVTRTGKFITLDAALRAIPKPTYPGAGTPKQLYYLTQFGAYEVPFAWWFKCTWLGGYPMGTDPIDDTQCTWRRSGNASQATGFGPSDPRLATLFKQQAPVSQTFASTSLQELLTEIPGIITQRILDQAYVDYVARRKASANMIAMLLQPIQRTCYQQKEYVPAFNGLSQEYQLQRLSQMYNGTAFNQNTTYMDSNGAVVCTGTACLQSTRSATLLASNADFASTISSIVQSRAILNTSIPLDTTTVPRLDVAAIKLLYSDGPISTDLVAALYTTFRNLPDGCSQPVTLSTPGIVPECLCSSSTSCSPTILAQMLARAKIHGTPSPLQAPLVTLAGTGLNLNLDVCRDLGISTSGTCVLNNGSIGVDLGKVSHTTLPLGVSAELYVEDRWDCVELQCIGEYGYMSGTKVPKDFKTFTMMTQEAVVIDEYEYDQAIPEFKSNPWDSQATQNKEQLCNDASTRFTATQIDHRSIVIGSWSVGSIDTQCDETCAIPSRLVSNPYTVRLRAWKVSYLINNTAVLKADIYPCATTPLPLPAIMPSFGSALPFGRFWNPSKLPGYLADFDVLNTYRPNASTFHLRTCTPTGTGLPTAPDLSMQSIRSAAWGKDVTDMQATLDAMNKVVSNVNSISSEDCVQSTSCTSSTSSLAVAPWSSPQTGAECTTLKNDPFFGCMMFPGEMSHPMSSGDYAGYACTSDNSHLKFSYSTCMSDDALDPCRSTIPAYRSMNLTGRRLSYKQTTIAPDCTLGPVTQCALVDELQNLPVAVDACPGTNKTSDRWQGYKTLHAFNRLNTNVELSGTLNGDMASTIDTWFDHMFLALNPGYSCCPGCRPQCSSTTIPIEMRHDLWLCLGCPLVSAVQCIGSHNCLLTPPTIPTDSLSGFDGWNSLPADQRSFLTDPPTSSRPGYTIDVAAPAITWLITQISNLWTPDIRLSYEIPAFMASFTGSYAYNPIPIVRYNNYMLVSSKTCGTVTGRIPDFSNCSYDSHRRNLRDFVHDRYKTDDGAIIQPGNTLQWKVRRTQMITQNIPQWETVAANRSGMFISDVLDDKWCTAGGPMDNACYVHSENGQTIIEVLNPGLLGAFEPRDGCDTAIVNQQRVISAICADCSSPSEYMAIENGDFMSCPQTLTAAQQVTINDAAPSNLCSKAPTPASSCQNQHGMLGQTTYDGQPVSSVYARQPWPGGLPTGVSSNPLFQGRAPGSVVSNLVLSPLDIGGHYVRMGLTQTRGGAYAMSIQALPLSSYSDALSAAAYSLGVSGSDMRWTQVDKASETYRLQTLYPNSICAAWDCPLRRRAFYMGSDPGFRPQVPDPLRTQILYGTRAHPTQTAGPMPVTVDQSRVLGVYYTSNGFCACTTPPCTACPADLTALRGGWANSSAAQSTCTEQLDWPYAGGVLRDGSTIAQRWNTTAPCAILDRLPTFQYRYKNLQRTFSSTRTTLDKGGVCHMGWPAMTAGPLAGCYILAETDTFMCPAFLAPKNVTRLRAKTISELVGSGNRPRLADCTPPPTFKFGNNATTAPEVSYGQVKRWEAARLLANDLRRRLCGNSTRCKPASQWSLPTFWASVYTANFPPIPGGNGQNQSLWARPWVACKQNQNGTQTCDGQIQRSTWATGNRPQICLDTLTASPTASQLTQNINICDLDSSLDLFCRTVQDARYRVFEANCLYSGQCRQQLFFYQPSTYEINNNEFVRNTVQNFYNSTVRGACMPDQDTAAQILINGQNLEKCAATQLNTVVDCIQLVRIIVSDLVECAYYAGELFLTIFQLFGASDAQKPQITTQINAILALIRTKFLLLFNAIGDLFYKILFEGPMGSWLNTMIQKICSFLEWIFSDIVYVVLCFVRTSSIGFLDTVARGVVGVLNGISFGKLGYLDDDITSAIATIQNNIPCAPQKLWSCNLPFNDANATVDILPLPTRCWAGVEPGVNSLACTVADTCMQSDYSNIICGACPAASSMTQFGCNTLTKLCSCDVFPVGVTACASHEECTMDNTDVSCQYVDSYLQPSYGNVPCSQCPRPVCLITDGGLGQCSCLLRPVPSQQCSGVGSIVSPDASQLCLIATAGSSQISSSTSYTADYRTLASTPCMLLNRAQALCMTVYTSASVSTPLVVGLALLATHRRRLLETTVFIPPNVSTWADASEPCRSLAMADVSRLGILENYTRAECWRWHDVGARLIAVANMTGVSPFFMVSWRDLVDAMLTPGTLVELFAKLPQILHAVLLHSEAAQPAYIALAYWLSSLSNTSWLHNETILAQARTFLSNASSPRRRLLSTTEITPPVTAEVAYLWNQGPYSWPPNFVFWQGDQSCAAVSTAVDVLANGLKPTVQFYQSSPPPPGPIQWPTLPFRYRPVSLQQFDTLEGVLSNLTTAWLDEDQIRSFVANASYVKHLKAMVQCNFTEIQTCSDRYSILDGAMLTLVCLLGIGFAAKIVGMPYVEPILLVLATPLWFYITYGYSPTCIPLLPTCFLSDLLGAIDQLLPPSIAWPAELTTSPNCTSVSCLRSCNDDPVLGFSTWYDHIAWALCEADEDWALGVAFARPVASPLRMSILRKCGANTASMTSAQRICFSITAVKSVPILGVCLLALWLVPIIASALLAILQFVANLAFLFVLFVHAGD